MLHRALVPASQEASHPVEPAELWEVLLPELREASSESSQREAFPAQCSERLPAEQAPVHHPVQPGAHRQDAAVSRHARRALPEAHPADVVVQAPSKERAAVLRSMEQAQRPELAEEALLGAQPEELSAQVLLSARARPSELDRKRSCRERV